MLEIYVTHSQIYIVCSVPACINGYIWYIIFIIDGNQIDSVLFCGSPNFTYMRICPKRRAVQYIKVQITFSIFHDRINFENTTMINKGFRIQTKQFLFMLRLSLLVPNVATLRLFQCYCAREWWACSSSCLIKSIEEPEKVASS